MENRVPPVRVTNGVVGSDMQPGLGCGPFPNALALTSSPPQDLTANIGSPVVLNSPTAPGNGSTREQTCTTPISNTSFFGTDSESEIEEGSEGNDSIDGNQEAMGGAARVTQVSGVNRDGVGDSTEHLCHSSQQRRDQLRHPPRQFVPSLITARLQTERVARLSGQSPNEAVSTPPAQTFKVSSSPDSASGSTGTPSFITRSGSNDSVSFASSLGAMSGKRAKNDLWAALPAPVALIDPHHHMLHGERDLSPLRREQVPSRALFSNSPTRRLPLGTVTTAANNVVSPSAAADVSESGNAADPEVGLSTETLAASDAGSLSWLGGAGPESAAGNTGRSKSRRSLFGSPPAQPARSPEHTNHLLATTSAPGSPEWGFASDSSGAVLSTSAPPTPNINDLSDKFSQGEVDDAKSAVAVGTGTTQPPHSAINTVQKPTMSTATPSLSSVLGSRGVGLTRPSASKFSTFPGSSVQRSAWSDKSRQRSGSRRKTYRPPPTPRATPQWMQRQRQLSERQAHNHSGLLASLSARSRHQSHHTATSEPQLAALSLAVSANTKARRRDASSAAAGIRARSRHASSAYESLSQSKMLMEIDMETNLGAGGSALRRQWTPGVTNGVGNFAQNFEMCGQLGSGNFSDVFLVQSRCAPPSPPWLAGTGPRRTRTLTGNGPPPVQNETSGLFAVKKTKFVLRSRRDRDAQLQEIKVYEHLCRCARALKDAGDALQVAGGLHHIVRYFAAWQEEGYLYIKMEVCNAGNMLQYISREFGQSRRIPTECLWEWTAQVAAGLRFLHACRYVHLDIKPDNIFICEDATGRGDSEAKTPKCG